MAKLSSLKADLQREQDGVWVPHPELEGVAFRIASFHSPAYHDLLTTLMDRRKALLNCTVLSDDQLEDINKEAVARAVLKDWRGIDNEDGTPRPYSAEEGLKEFRDPEQWRLWNWVCAQAGKESFYRRQAVEELKGN